jgi:hypothetical protein
MQADSPCLGWQLSSAGYGTSTHDVDGGDSMICRRTTWLAMALALILLYPTSLVLSQGIAELVTYSVDTSDFPVVRVKAAPIDAEGMAVRGLAQGSFRIYEDGVVRDVNSAKPVDVGVQVAIILDAPKSIMQAGPTGKLRRDEAIDAIDELVMTDKWVNRAQQLDWTLLMMPLDAERSTVIQDWTRDYTNIHNEAYVFDYAKQPTYTALYAMLIDAMARMKDAPGYEQRARFLLVLSDGVDKTSVEQIEDVINRAHALDVTVLAIKIGAEGAGEARTLSRIARMTGGAYVAYSGIESLEPVYRLIRAQRQQYELEYRSAITQSGKHTLEVGLESEGQEVRGGATEVGIVVQAPEVRITAPPSGTVYERIGDTWDADPKLLEPRSEAVTYEVHWPDGYPRAVRQVSYVVDGVYQGETDADGTLVWSFAELGAGTHSLQLEVTDELGLTGRSNPLQVVVSIQLPPPPEPSLPPAMEVVQERFTTLSLFSIASLALAGVAILVAAYVLIRRPQVVQEVASAFGNVVREATQPFRRDRRRSSTTARASLVQIMNDGTRGTPIPLNAQVLLLGRDPTRCHIVFAHNTVSRLHARIVEVEDGVFTINDEGSTSGTYVNDAQVVAGGTRLSPGDRIELGHVQLTFDVAGRPDGGGDEWDPTQPFTPEGTGSARQTTSPETDKTEPFVPKPAR